VLLECCEGFQACAVQGNKHIGRHGRQVVHSILYADLLLLRKEFLILISTINPISALITIFFITSINDEFAQNFFYI